MAAIVRPSGSHQWKICAGSHDMQQKFPEISGRHDNTASEQGTAAHWVSSDVILDAYINGKDVPKSHNIVGTEAENGVLIDEEMFEAASGYAMEILKHLRGYLTYKDLHVEEKVKLDHIYPGMSGTPDAWLYDAGTKTLYIWDLKFGHGWVEVFENSQLIIYVSGILQTLPKDPDIKVVMTIYQPRAFHPEGICRKWEIEATALRSYVNQLHHSAHIAMGEGEKECKSGTHCRYCSARRACKALQGTVYNSIDVVTGNIPMEIPMDEIGNEIVLLKRVSSLIKHRLDALEEEALFHIKKGEVVPGLGAKTKFGRKRWKADIDPDEVIMMGDLMGVDLRKPQQLDTPTQAKNKLKKLKLDESVVDAYSEVPKSGVELVIDDTTKIKQIFGRNKGE